MAIVDTNIKYQLSLCNANTMILTKKLTKTDIIKMLELSIIIFIMFN